MECVYIIEAEWDFGFNGVAFTTEEKALEFAKKAYETHVKLDKDDPEFEDVLDNLIFINELILID